MIYQSPDPSPASDPGTHRIRRSTRQNANYPTCEFSEWAINPPCFLTFFNKGGLSHNPGRRPKILGLCHVFPLRKRIRKLQKLCFCTWNPVFETIKLKIFAPAAHLDKKRVCIVMFLFVSQYLHSSEVSVCVYLLVRGTFGCHTM